MPPDDMSDAEADMAEQERWGMSRSDMILARLVRLMKVSRTRYQELEARVTALENKS